MSSPIPSNELNNSSDTDVSDDEPVIVEDDGELNSPSWSTDGSITEGYTPPSDGSIDFDFSDSATGFEFDFDDLTDYNVQTDSDYDYSVQTIQLESSEEDYMDSTSGTEDTDVRIRGSFIFPGLTDSASGTSSSDSTLTPSYLIRSATGDVTTSPSSNTHHITRFSTDAIDTEVAENQRDSDDNGDVSNSVEMTDDQSTIADGRQIQNTPSAAKTDKKNLTLSPNSDDDGCVCTICFESFTNSGDHRLASLKCGHVFGFVCIQKWLKGQGTKCPQCNEKAKKSEIRIIYARSLKVLDTSERDRALHDLEKERQLRRKAEIEVARVKFQYESARAENSKLQHQLDVKNCGASGIKSSNNLSQKNDSSGAGVKFILEKTIELSKDGRCRVLATCEDLNMIAVSQNSTNNLFPGYGVKKINTMDFRSTEFVCLHNMPIRDIAFNPEGRNNGLLLSVSMDKAIKLTSMLSNSVVQTYSYDMPLWSCTWNLDNHFQFFAGTTNGKAILFDTRNTSQFVREIQGIGYQSPVVSMKYVKQRSDAPFKYGGLLVCQLSQCVFNQATADGEFVPHMLPVQGNFTSVSFDNVTRHLLITSRPYTECRRSRHLMGELKIVGNDQGITGTSCNILQTMWGGSSHKMLSRSCLFSCTDDSSKIFACAGDESSLSTKLWDVSTGQLSAKLSSTSPVLDVGVTNSGSNQFMLSLTEKVLCVYRVG